jgi:hypothetical protein
VTDESEKSKDILRGASDGLLIAIREVDARERAKRGVHPDDPGFESLARDVTRAAEAVLKLAELEEARARETSGRAGPPMPTINASAPPASLGHILAEWRAVERSLADAHPASAEAERLMAEFETLRDRYRQALDALQRKE